MDGLDKWELDDKWPGTPFPHLLLTNQAPSDEERLALGIVKAEYMNEIRAFGLEVLGLKQFNLYIKAQAEILKAKGVEMSQRIAEMRIRVDQNLLTEKEVSNLEEEGSKLNTDADEVDRLQSVLESSMTLYEATGQRHHQILSHLANLHSSALSALRRVPPELLVEIFQYIRPARQFMAERTSAFIDEGITFAEAFNFTQVCSLWRCLALQTPSLWTDIPSVTEEYGVQNDKGVYQLVDTFLVRSRGLPIHVVIALPHYDLEDQSPPFNIPAIIPHLFNTARRWKTAYICLPSEFVSRMGPFAFPMLERLNVRSIGPEYPLFPRTFFGDTPRLQQVYSDGRYALAQDGDDALPLPLLTGVKSFVGLPRSSVDLALCRETLVEFTLRGSLFRTRLYPEDKVRYPELRHLSVMSINSREFEDERNSIFQCIEAPSLETLIVSGVPEILSVATLTSHIIQHTLVSPVRLRRLTLHLTDIRMEDIMKIIRSASLLEELDVYLGEVEDNWHDLLIPDREPPDYVDNLKRLPLVRKLRSLSIRNVRLARLQSLQTLHESRNPLRITSTNLYNEPHNTGLPISVQFRSYELLLASLDYTPGWEYSDEGWDMPVPGSEYLKLLGWGTHLMKQFVARRNLNPRQLMLRGRKMKERYLDGLRWDLLIKHQLNQFFQLVERHEVQDPRLLEITGIFQVMQQLAGLNSSSVWGDEQFAFRERASAKKEQMKVPLSILDDGLTVTMGLSTDTYSTRTSKSFDSSS